MIGILMRVESPLAWGVVVCAAATLLHIAGVLPAWIGFTIALFAAPWLAGIAAERNEGPERAAGHASAIDAFFEARGGLLAGWGAIIGLAILSVLASGTSGLSHCDGVTYDCSETYMPIGR